VNAAFALVKRLPPKQVARTLAGMANLVQDEDTRTDLMDKIISSLVVCTDEGGRDYLQHEYNRDGDSYRSPWSNKYNPPTESSFFPSPALRSLEEKAFNIFTSYVKLYYGEATSSVFMMDPIPGAAPGFSGCYLVKKNLED